jgi:hypothetical protein
MLLVGIAVAGGGAVLWAAASHIHDRDPPWLHGFKLRSKNWVVDAIEVVMRRVDGLDEAVGPVTPLDGPAFAYEDLDDPYFQQIRRDPRIAHFYGAGPPDVEDAARMADFIRDRFERGPPDRSVDRAGLLELLDRADGGESFLCGTAAKMLVQMVQAGGGVGRIVRVTRHTVVEIWSERWGRWVLVDPDTNVTYENRAGEPLSTLEIHERARRGDLSDLVARPGRASKTLYSEDLMRRQMRVNYAPGFAIDFYARWASLDLPRWHPRRSPSVTAVYYGADAEGGHPYFDRVVSDPSPLYAPPTTLRAAEN